MKERSSDQYGIKMNYSFWEVEVFWKDVGNSLMLTVEQLSKKQLKHICYWAVDNIQTVIFCHFTASFFLTYNYKFKKQCCYSPFISVVKNIINRKKMSFIVLGRVTENCHSSRIRLCSLIWFEIYVKMLKAFFCTNFLLNWCKKLFVLN